MFTVFYSYFTVLLYSDYSIHTLPAFPFLSAPGTEFLRGGGGGGGVASPTQQCMALQLAQKFISTA
jgi:hypothetical protein